MGAVVAVLDLERGRVAPGRNADVVDGGDEVVQSCVAQGTRSDDLLPAAEVAGFHAVRDDAAQPAAVDAGVGRGALLELAGLGSHAHSPGRSSSSRTSSRRI